MLLEVRIMVALGAGREWIVARKKHEEIDSRSVGNILFFYLGAGSMAVFSW